jgi:GDPmannose 4,6-dehydratase
VKVGNLDSLRTFADARDAVRAYYTLLNAEPFSSDYYNIGGTHTCTVGEMLDYLLSISSRDDIVIEPDPARFRPIDADLQIPDCSKFNTRYKWERRYSFHDTMADLLEYWRCKIANNPNVLTR